MKNLKLQIGKSKLLALLFGKIEARDEILVTGAPMSIAQAAARYGRTTTMENVALIADEGSESAMVAEGFANEMGDDAYVQLTPYGDFPHPKGIQRVTKASAEKMANNFHSMLGKLKRRFKGVPVYRGHPDVPGLANEYSDDQSYAWMEDLQAREDGLYGKPAWSEEGVKLVKNKAYRFPSCYWDAAETGRDAKSSKIIWEPHTLISVGLTNKPRIPVQALANAETETQDKGTKMERSILAALLGLAATATDADITNKITDLRGLPGRVSALENAETTAKGEVEKQTTALKAAGEKLANVQKQRNTLALENAIALGQITPAQREETEAALNADFEATLKKLGAAKGMKTKSALDNDAGERRAALANAQEVAGAKFRSAVQTLKGGGMAHHDAWMAAKAAHPDLYQAMSATEEEAS